MSSKTANNIKPQPQTEQSTQAVSALKFIREVQKGAYSPIYPETLRYSRMNAQAEPFVPQDMQTYQWLS